MSKKLIYLVSFVLVLSVAGNASADLMAYWKINEGSGDFVEDFSLYGNHGTVDKAVWVTEAMSGGAALEFNGQDSQVTVADSASLHPDTGNITVGAWIKVFSNPKGWSNGGAIVYKGSAYQWIINYDGTLWLGIWGGRLTSTGTYDFEEHMDEWHHVTTTYDSATQQGQIYVDGELNVEGTINAAIDPTTNELYLGYKADGGGRFHGIIDEVRISDIVRTQDEIKASMLGGAGYPPAQNPNPPDGSIHESTWVNLSWKAGDFAVSHDVYLGDNFDDVNDGAESTFQGNQAATKLIAGFPGFAYPDGLVPGKTYYWRIDEVNDANDQSPWRGDVWSFLVPSREAYGPAPADAAKFVVQDVTLSWKPGFDAKLHTIYFGDNFDDVNNAAGGLPQTGTTYTPGTLELEKTYYWRIDEFDGAVTHKGNVWTYTTLPVIAVADDPNLVALWTFDEGMGTTAFDWSGHGNHGTLFGPGWTTPGLLGDASLNFKGSAYMAIQNLSYNSSDNTEVTVSLWIRTESPGNQYIVSFDRDQYWRLGINLNGVGLGQVGWHIMTSSGQTDLGSKSRVDDGLWHHVCGVFDKGRTTIYIDGLRESSVSGGSTFGTGNPRFGLLGANCNATTFNGSQGTGSPLAGDLDDLRIYDRALTQEEIIQVMRGDPLIAWGPKPSNGSTPYIRDATPLSWSPGDNASQHDVYFGIDRGSVADADESDTTGIYRGRQDVTIYTPAEGVEWGGGPYYWRIDEYNNDATISRGNVWTFTVADYLTVDDFEDYNDYPPDEIFSMWIDGYGIDTNGSTAGYPDPDFLAGEHYVETTIVHGGGQSMPLFYENNFKYSEVTMTLVSARDWTEEGVGVLSLWFYGDASNAAERMYVALNGSAVIYQGNPDAALIDEWTQWTIDLQEFASQGVNLANVNTITIGFGDKDNLQAGGSGMVFFDDIRLYRPAEPEPEPQP
ncbi:hypothetical protein ES705_17442 [subsurface metagenome]